MAATPESIMSFGSHDDEYDWDYIRSLADIDRYIRNYVIGATLVIGSIGNILSVITLQTKSFRGTATGFVLTALALADIAVLNTGALYEILIINGIDMSKFSGLSCKAQYYGQIVSVQISSWTLVLVTMERMVAVAWPHKVHLFCTRRRMAIVWAVIVAALLLAQSFDPILIDLREIEESTDGSTNGTIRYKFCTYPAKIESLVDEYTLWSDFVIAAVLPGVLIFTGNVIIIKTLQQGKVTVKGSATAQKASSVTVMLVTVCVVFLLTTWPMRVFYFGGWGGIWFTSIAEDELEFQKFKVAWVVVNALLYLNYAVNFLLYLLTGSRFRKAFVSLFKCRQQAKKSSVSGP